MLGCDCGVPSQLSPTTTSSGSATSVLLIRQPGSGFAIPKSLTGLALASRTERLATTLLPYLRASRASRAFLQVQWASWKRQRQALPMPVPTCFLGICSSAEYILHASQRRSEFALAFAQLGVAREFPGSTIGRLALCTGRPTSVVTVEGRATTKPSGGRPASTSILLRQTWARCLGGRLFPVSTNDRIPLPG